MGLFKRQAPNKDVVVAAQEEAPKFERVDWKKDPGLRKLYWHVFVLSIASATTGYDGMFFNSVQNFDSWKNVSHSLASRYGLKDASFHLRFGAIVMPFQDSLR